MKAWCQLVPHSTAVDNRLTLANEPSARFRVTCVPAVFANPVAGNGTMRGSRNKHSAWATPEQEPWQGSQASSTATDAIVSHRKGIIFRTSPSPMSGFCLGWRTTPLFTQFLSAQHLPLILPLLNTEKWGVCNSRQCQEVLER